MCESDVVRKVNRGSCGASSSCSLCEFVFLHPFVLDVKYQTGDRSGCIFDEYCRGRHLG